MPMVVKAPDHQAVLFNEVSFGLVSLAAQVGRLVVVVIERRFMHDDQILSGGVRPLANV